MKIHIMKVSSNSIFYIQLLKDEKLIQDKQTDDKIFSPSLL